MAAPSSSARLLTALVTGANKGIGFEIAKQLLGSARVGTVFVGSRSGERGKAAVSALGDERARVVELDLDSEESVKAAVATVRGVSEQLDILVNNAGRAFKGDAFDEHVARETIKTNYYGTKRVSDAFFPMLAPGARVVNVASFVSQKTLGSMSEALRKEFLAEDLTVTGLDALMERFCVDVAEGKEQERGWPRTTYGVSKVGVSMLTRIQARDCETPGVVISAVCPGWVQTDMSSHSGNKTPAEGADTPVYCCFLGDDAPTGVFWSDREQKGWI